MIEFKQKAQIFKTVEYFGFKVDIPVNHSWIAFGSDGKLFSYYARPVRLAGEWDVDTSDNGFLYLGQVESDFDWRDSLVFIG